MVRQCYRCRKVGSSTSFPDLSFHRFPSDSRKRAEWLRRLRVQDNAILPKYAFLCSLHFNPDEFEVTSSGAKVLKKYALPLRYAPDTVESLNVSTSSDSTGSSPTGQSVPQVLSLTIETEKESSASNDDYVIDSPPPIMRYRATMPGVCTNSRINTDKSGKENENHEDSAVIVKTENEDWLSSISQSASQEMSEEKCESRAVTTENVWLPSISQSESSHMIEEIKEESIEIVDENVIVKTENEVCLPFISQYEIPEMIEENKYESIEIVNENVIVKTENEACLPSVSQSASPEMIEENCEDSEVIIESVVWKMKYENLLNKYEAVVKENEEIKRQMRLSYGVMKEDKKQLKRLEKDLKDLTSKLSSETAYRSQTENSIKRFLSKAQRDIVLRQRKTVLWSSEDISQALAIRNISKKCYIYLREQIKYPLPDLSSLSKWATKLNVQQTILTDETCKES